MVKPNFRVRRDGRASELSMPVSRGSIPLYFACQNRMFQLGSLCAGLQVQADLAGIEGSSADQQFEVGRRWTRRPAVRLFPLLLPAVRELSVAPVLFVQESLVEACNPGQRRVLPGSRRSE